MDGYLELVPRCHERVVSINATYHDLAPDFERCEENSAIPSISTIVYRSQTGMIEIVGRQSDSDLRFPENANLRSILREISAVAGRDVHVI